MLGALGLPVTKLHREAIGGLALDLDPGECRLLGDDEVREQLGFAGLRQG